MEDEERMWTPGKRQMAGLGKKELKTERAGATKEGWRRRTEATERDEG